jgi:hypothetical protein
VRALDRALALAGVLLVCGACTAAAVAAPPLRWSAPRLVDPAAVPLGHFVGFSAVSCPSGSLCVAVDEAGNAFTSTDPNGGASTWRLTARDVPNVAVSCSSTSTSLCVAVGSTGNVSASTDPTDGTWTDTDVDGNDALTGVSCPSTSLCAAVDRQGNVVTSTDPAEGMWTVTDVDGTDGLTGVSCPSAVLCVAVDSRGNVLTSTDPTGGASTWTESPVDSLDALESISCPSTSLCVAIDENGNVVTTHNPTDAHAWTMTPLGFCPSSCGFQSSISCPSASLCVAGDGIGEVVTSTDPTGGASAWSAPALVDSPRADYCLGSFLRGELCRTDVVACGSASSCVMADALGNIASTPNPAAGGSSWRLAGVDGANGLFAISCSSTSLCVGLDDAGRVLSSTDAASARPSWDAGLIASLGNHGGQGVSCPSRSLCVAVGTETACGIGCLYSGTIVASTHPAAGPKSWAGPSVGRQSVANDVSCPSVALCVVSGGPQVSSSTRPAAGPSAWKTITFNGAENLLGVSCPTASLCVTADDDGTVLTSRHPTGAASAWKATRVTTIQAGLLWVSCPSESLCVADDSDGNILTSTHPTGGPTAWKSVHVGGGTGQSNVSGLGRVACPSVSLCMVLDGAAHGVLTATDPTGSASAWRPTSIDPGSDLTALTCPSASLCLAGDASGNVLVGTGPAANTTPGVTRRAAVAALTGSLRHSCARARTSHLLNDDGCVTPFSAPGAGTITLTWLTSRHTAIAVGHLTIRSRSAVRVHVRLTAHGRHILRGTAGRVHIRVVATFRDAAGHLYEKTARVTLGKPGAAS